MPMLSLFRKDPHPQIKDTHAQELQELKRENKALLVRLKKESNALAKASHIKRQELLAATHARTTFEFLGYDHIFKDGILQAGSVFSEVISFSDIYYEGASDEVKENIYAKWIHLFSTQIPDAVYTLSYLVTPDREDDADIFSEEAQSAHTKELACWYNAYFKEKAQESTHGLKKEMYITYAIEADTYAEALKRLVQVRSSILGVLRELGCTPTLLTQEERVALMQTLAHSKHTSVVSKDGFHCTQELIAPDAIETQEMNLVVDGATYVQTVAFKSFGDRVNDTLISSILKKDIPLHLSISVKKYAKEKAVAMVNMHTALVDRERIQYSQKQASKGLDSYTLPPHLQGKVDNCTYLTELMRESVNTLYEVLVLVQVFGDTQEEVHNHIFELASLLSSYGITLDMLIYRQKEAYQTSLLTGIQYLEPTRLFATTELACLLPFANYSLTDAQGIYIGQNVFSKELIFFDRRQSTSPMAVVCGKTGSGKSFSVKNELTQIHMLDPEAQIFIFDVNGEYSELVELMDGTTIHMNNSSHTYLNPLHMHAVNKDETDNKCEAILAQAEASAQKTGSVFDDASASILERALRLAIATAHVEGRQATIADLHHALKQQDEPHAQELALRYERMVEGSHTYFNHETNVDLSTSSIVNFNLKDLPDSLRTFALITLCECVRSHLYQNKENKRLTYIFIEEIQSMFTCEQVVAYFSRFANEARKFGGIVTAISQSGYALLENPSARNLVLNSDSIRLYLQSPTDANMWKKYLKLSDAEYTYILNASQGAGLLWAHNQRVCFENTFSEEDFVYRYFNTDPKEKASGDEVLWLT